jgi:arsenical-resistance protein 2
MSKMASAQEPGSTLPWYAAYPTPTNAQPRSVTREEMLKMKKASNRPTGRDFVLVDLRRNDHEVRSSLGCWSNQDGFAAAP